MIKVIMFILLTISFSHSIEVINLSEKIDKLEEFKIEIYEDKLSSATFKEIKNKSFEVSTNSISEGYTSSTFWIRFNAKNISSDSLKYYIKFTDTYQDKIDCYIESSDNKYTLSREGVGYFKDNQRNALVKPAFLLELNQNEKKTVYLKISSKYPVFTSFNIYNKESLYKYNYKLDVLYALYFGAIMALILYNLFIYIYTRDIAYTYYILFAISFVSWQLILNGYYPLNSFNSTKSFYIFSSSIPLSMGFLFYFSRYILETQKFFVKIDGYLMWIGRTFFILSIVALYDFNISATIFNAITSVTLPLLLYIGYISYKNGNKIALYYLIAQISFISTATLFSLSAYGVLEYCTTNRHALIIGSFFEMTLFSLALAYRIKRLEDDKVSIIKKANNELEAKVKERTLELEVSKKELQKLANKDFLTGLLNRRSMNEISSRLINIAKRENNPLSIILIDLDKFKSINDEYGHIAGDIVLKEFSSVLSTLREADVSARIGGEEFVVILSNTGLDGAYKIAQKIRRDCENLDIIVDDKINIKMTISGGVATLDNTDKDIYDLIKKADKLLYEAKNSGRNRIK